MKNETEEVGGLRKFFDSHLKVTNANEDSQGRALLFPDEMK
jgi:hypothetical protein